MILQVKINTRTGVQVKLQYFIISNIKNFPLSNLFLFCCWEKHLGLSKLRAKNECRRDGYFGLNSCSFQVRFDPVYMGLKIFNQRQPKLIWFGLCSICFGFSSFWFLFGLFLVRLCICSVLLSFVCLCLVQPS